MAVEKMELISIIGPLNDFDRIVMQYVIDNDIHIENMFNLLENTKGVYPFTTENPYESLIQLASSTIEYAGITPKDIPKGKFDMPPQEIEQYLKALNLMLQSLISKKKEYEERLKENNSILQQLMPIKNASVKFDDLFNFEYVKVRFGKMPQDSYAQMDAYLQDYNTFFFPFDRDNENVFDVYFAPSVMKEKIDSIFSSLYFQRVMISDRAHGTPAETIEELNTENTDMLNKINELDYEMKKIIDKEYSKICKAYLSAHYLYETYAARKYAVHTKESFYIAGWMAADEVLGLKKKLSNEPNVTLLIEEADQVRNVIPPTKLKNPKIFKPFESFVEMYGLPAYNEIDPTIIFALTYSLMFGIMYGDVGHGITLALLGLFMAKKKIFLGPILEVCGIISIVFGVLYGSVFGYEEFIPTLWYKPMHNSNTMMQTLIMAVAFGTVLISISMIINIINGVRQKKPGKILFDSNGLAGFVFYWAIIIGVLAMLYGRNVMTIWYVALFVVLPLLLVFFKEPLSHLMEKRKDWIPKNKGEFLLETFFEMFELLLSYITNTISFIRIGAFALNHAGMLAVVFTLADMTKGASSIVVIIIGNIVVIGLEGLLVAIQVLRLQFYEMFSRFFGGNGKPFKKLGGI